MVAGEILSKLRLVIAETGQTRWTDTALLGFINDAQRQVGYEIDFPEASYKILTIPGQREYQLVDVMKLLRIYILTPGGSQQPIPLVDIATLEGTTLEIYDQSSGQIQGVPPNTPQWLAEQPQAYPVQSPWITQSPYSTATPYQSVTFGGQRPLAYIRGGFLGIVPPPSGTYTIIVDNVPAPLNLNSNADKCIYPDGFKDAIVYKAAEYVFISDRSTQADDMVRRFMNELPKLRAWKDNIKATMPKRMTPITKRTFFRGSTW